MEQRIGYHSTHSRKADDGRKDYASGHARLEEHVIFQSLLLDGTQKAQW